MKKEFLSGKSDSHITYYSFDNLWTKEAVGQPIVFDGWLLGLCVGGRITLAIDSERIDMENSGMVVNTPGRFFTIEKISEDFSGHFLVVSPDFMEDILLNSTGIVDIYLKLRTNNVISLEESERACLEPLFLSLAGILDRPDNWKTNTFKKILSSILCIVSDCLANPARDYGFQNDFRTGPSHVLVEFFKLLEAERSMHHSVKYYADRLCVTPKYLSTLLKAHTGKTASDWIEDYVTAEAKNLLKYSSKTIKEIAYELNFTTQSFFGKFFRRQTGTSPLKYRIQNV